ncbi:MAG: hypothetical protein ABIH78_02975 [Candidatus Peregrinibacteria bacterium]
MGVRVIETGDSCGPTSEVSWLGVFSSDVAGCKDMYEWRGEGDLLNILRQIVNEGAARIAGISQPTQAECDERLPGGRDKYCAEAVGYPLPKGPVLQREFLELAERKAKLAELREEGDLQKIAEYETDCFNAIFSGSMGYRPAIFDEQKASLGDNDSIDDIVKSSSRGCGGMAVQAAYWMKELGLKAFMLRGLHNVFGGEGHVSFIAVDAKDDTYFFDPAMRLPCTKIPDDFYEAQEGLQLKLSSLSNGKMRRVRIEARDFRKAYEMCVSPHVVASTLDDGLIDIFAFWTMINKKLNPGQKLLIPEQLDDPDDMDVVPLHMIHERIEIFVNMGEREKALQECRRALQINPKGMSTLRFVSAILIHLGATEEGMSVIIDYLVSAADVFKNFWETISRDLKTIENRPGAVYVLRWWGSIGEIVSKMIEHTHLLFYSGKESGTLSKKTADGLFQTAKNLFEMYLYQFAVLDEMITVTGLENDIDLTRQNGEILSSYARLKQVYERFLAKLSG